MLNRRNQVSRKLNTIIDSLQEERKNIEGYKISRVEVVTRLVKRMEDVLKVEYVEDRKLNRRRLLVSRIQEVINKLVDINFTLSDIEVGEFKKVEYIVNKLIVCYKASGIQLTKRKTQQQKVVRRKQTQQKVVKIEIKKIEENDLLERIIFG